MNGGVPAPQPPRYTDGPWVQSANPIPLPGTVGVRAGRAMP